MPSNLHLLVVILAGYLFVHACDYLHYRAKALEGHRLVVEASLAGLALFAVVRPVINGLQQIDDRFLASSLQAFWYTLSKGLPYSGTLVVTTLLAFPLAKGWNLFQGYRRRELIGQALDGLGWRQKLSRFNELSRALALEDAISRTGNDLLMMLHAAATRWPHDFTMLGVTMSDRKLYVGWAVRSPRLTQQESYFAILPLMSGYRDDKTLKPVFNFFYPVDVEAVQSHRDDYRQFVILPLSGVSSARLLSSDFDPEELAGQEPEADAQQELDFVDD